MTKKLFLFFMSFIFTLSVMREAAAAEAEFSFVLSTEKSELKTGERTEVTLRIIKNSGGEAFEIFGMQDYVCFDPEYLKFVDGSIKSGVFNASALQFDAAEYNRVFVNRASTAGIEVPQNALVLSFELEAVKSGACDITHRSPEMLGSKGESLSVSVQTAGISISEKDKILDGKPKDDNKGENQGGFISGGGGGGSTAPEPVKPAVTAPPEVVAGDDKAAVQLPFADVAENAWYYDAVSFVFARGLMRGMSEDSFEPDTPISRAMVVTVLWRMEGEPEAESSAFGDLTQDWYIKAVDWAAANGIVKGYDNSHFGPSDDMTREQITAVFYRYAGYKGYKFPENGEGIGFEDAADISAWAAESVRWASDAGLIRGRAEGRFDPAGSATRAELATILMRFSKLTDQT